MELPATQTTLIQPLAGRSSFPPSPTTSPLPILRPGQILVRVHAVALNPTDYKMPTSFPTPGAVCGCDFAGTVVEVPHEGAGINGEDGAGAENRYVVANGDAVSDKSAGVNGTWRLGDRVLGAVHGSNPNDPSTGAFAHFVAAEADLVLRVPKGMGWDEAAAWGGIGWGTLGIALWEPERGLGLGWPWGKFEGRKGEGGGNEGMTGEKEKEWVLVNGGATATGALAVQLLKLAGYKPIATCSPQHASRILSLGAFATFDYNSLSCAADIRKYTSNGIRHALDCIADTASVQLCYAAMSRGGGRYACLELPSEKVLESRKAVSWRFVMGYEVFGREIRLPGGYGRSGETGQEWRRGAKRWRGEMQRLLDGGLVRVHPVEMVRDGWERGVVDGLERLRKGEVRGEKLVIQVGDLTLT